ncbi:hypothetical protein NI18_03805 [Sphingomonas sp. Ant20]|nr:hypothetical protein NI18_03805 [Sphingomonas sp. Ant20]
MLRQIVEAGWRPMPRQIRRRCADMLRLLHQRLRHQPGRIPAPPEADDKIHPLFDRVDYPVGEAEGQLQVGVGLADLS